MTDIAKNIIGMDDNNQVVTKVNSLQKMKAQYTRNVPFWEYTVSYRLLGNKKFSVKSVLGKVMYVLNVTNKKPVDSRYYEGKHLDLADTGEVAKYTYYYNDPNETDQQRQEEVLKAFGTDKFNTSNHITDVLKELKLNEDYELFISKSEYVYKPRFKY